jgi:hypothetical protein
MTFRAFESAMVIPGAGWSTARAVQILPSKIRITRMAKSKPSPLLG